MGPAFEGANRGMRAVSGAACSGIETLLDRVGLTPEQVDHFYIAGGFGHYMNLTSADREHYVLGLKMRRL